MTTNKDFLAGLLFIVLGAGAALLSLQNDLGTVRNLGTGAFPLLVGGVVMLLGLAVAVFAVISADRSNRVERVDFRPLVLIIASTLAFGLLIDTFGVVIATATLVVLARMAGRSGSWRELLLMVVVLTAIPLGIFVYGLNLPFQLWP